MYAKVRDYHPSNAFFSSFYDEISPSKLIHQNKLDLRLSDYEFAFDRFLSLRPPITEKCQNEKKHIFLRRIFMRQKNTIIKMKQQKVFIKIQSEMLRNDNEQKVFFDDFFTCRARRSRLENGISRFISQFNVSIQNEDDKEKVKKLERKTFHVSFPYALLNFRAFALLRTL